VRLIGPMEISTYLRSVTNFVRTWPLIDNPHPNIQRVSTMRFCLRAIVRHTASQWPGGRVLSPDRSRRTYDSASSCAPSPNRAIRSRASRSTCSVNVHPLQRDDATDRVLFL